MDRDVETGLVKIDGQELPGALEQISVWHEIIIDETTHSYNYEAGAPAALSGVSVRIVPGQRGIFTAAQVEAVVRPDGAHFPHSRLVIVENTNNRGAGSIWPLDTVASLRPVAERHGLHIHMDGARLMNACTSSSERLCTMSLP